MPKASATTLSLFILFMPDPEMMITDLPFVHTLRLWISIILFLQKILLLTFSIECFVELNQDKIYSIQQFTFFLTHSPSFLTVDLDSVISVLTVFVSFSVFGITEL